MPPSLSKSTNFKSSLQNLKRESQKKSGTSKNALFDKLDELGKLLLLEDCEEIVDMLESDSLRQVLVANMLDLYKDHPIASLKLASAFLHNAFQKQISPFIHRTLENSVKNVDTWIQATDLLLQGILAYLDTDDNDQEAFGVAFYPTGCAVFASAVKKNLPAPWIKHLCNILTDAAGGCKSNITILRQKTWFGAMKLGELITSTREYLVLEALLELLPNILPSSLDPNLRRKFLDEFERGAPEKARTGADIRRLLANVSPESSWEKISSDIINCLAQVDITYPQPIPIISFTAETDQINHCSRLFVDNESFIINVPEKDGDMDTLQISFLSVEAINVNSSFQGKCCNVILSLNNPPVLAGLAMDSSSCPFIVKISFGDNYLPLFRSALSARKMTHLLGTSNGKNKPRLALSGSVNCEKPLKPGAISSVNNTVAKVTSSPTSYPLDENPLNCTGQNDTQILDDIEAAERPSKTDVAHNAGDNIADEMIIPLLSTISAGRCANRSKVDGKREVSPAPETSPSKKLHRESTAKSGDVAPSRPKPSRTYGTRQRKLSGSESNDVTDEITQRSSDNERKMRPYGTGQANLVIPVTENSEVSEESSLSTNTKEVEMKRQIHETGENNQINAITGLCEASDEETVAKKNAKRVKTTKDSSTGNTTNIKGILKSSLRQNIEPEIVLVAKTKEDSKAHIEGELSKLTAPKAVIKENELRENAVVSKKKQVKLLSMSMSSSAECDQVEDKFAIASDVDEHSTQVYEPDKLLRNEDYTLSLTKHLLSEKLALNAKHGKTEAKNLNIVSAIEVENPFNKKVSLRSTRVAPTEIVVPKNLPTIDLTIDSDEEPAHRKKTYKKHFPIQQRNLPAMARTHVNDPEQSYLQVSPPPLYSPIPPYSPVAPNDRPLHLIEQADLHLGSLNNPVSDWTKRPPQLMEELCKPERPFRSDMSSGLSEVLDVLNNIAEVITDNIRGKSDGLKLEARIGRDKLLNEAATSMDALHGENVNCYNQLLELKGKNDSFGTQILKSWDALSGSNKKLDVRLLELSKQNGLKPLRKYPGQLSTHLLPDSFREID